MHRTYTILVTLDSEDLPGTAQLAAQIQEFLEDPMGHPSASVDAFLGDLVAAGPRATGVTKLKRFHASLIAA